MNEYWSHHECLFMKEVRLDPISEGSPFMSTQRKRKPGLYRAVSDNGNDEIHLLCVLSQALPMC